MRYILCFSILSVLLMTGCTVESSFTSNATTNSPAQVSDVKSNDEDCDEYGRPRDKDRKDRKDRLQLFRRR